MPKARYKRQRPERVEEATKRDDWIKWKNYKESTHHATWLTELFSGYKKMDTKQIGGQSPQVGPDILKFIKKHDPDNSSGMVKESLDIMLKFQEAVKSGKLMTQIQPIQNILGGSLYGSMKSVMSQSKSKEKAAEEEPENNLFQEFLQAVLECAGEAAEEVGELLNSGEISRIKKALYSGEIYTSATMPQEFIDCVNKLIPIFRAKEEL